MTALQISNNSQTIFEKENNPTFFHEIPSEAALKNAIIEIDTRHLFHVLTEEEWNMYMIDLYSGAEL